MRRVLALLVLGALSLFGFLHEPAASKLVAAPAPPLAYPDVQPVFAKRCAGCHDARIGNNPAAQAVFEMTSYPFATRRPATLLGDLRRGFETRTMLTPAEKALGLKWLAGGGLDADGKPPRWR